ncbi:hypothetical protein B0H13DRAFT_2339040 [Mycena leptocephala]|nr:hypothetical protein B0H13DRAFT_2339040 [Mycena leptocephala]
MDPAFQDLIFGEILTMERAPKKTDLCEGCSVADTSFLCRTCFWPQFLCRQCLLESHEQQPLHRIESKANNNTFHGTTLQALGLQIHLGHGSGGKCPNPEIDTDFTISGVDGTHELERVRLYGWKTKHSAVTFELARFSEENCLRVPGQVAKGSTKGKRASLENTSSVSRVPNLASGLHVIICLVCSSPPLLVPVASRSRFNLTRPARAGTLSSHNWLHSLATSLRTTFDSSFHTLFTGTQTLRNSFDFANMAEVNEVFLTARKGIEEDFIYILVPLTALEVSERVLGL